MLTFPNAKINLGLNITEKRPDGYHNLETIFYPVPIEDALEINILNEGKGKFRLHQAGLEIEGEAENNLVVKAYKLLDDRFNLPPVDIHLFKHIPSGAGLGGGSADAAFMLKLLNNKFELGLPDDTLETYATKLGADCAFFIRNRPTYAEGIGNIFSPLPLCFPSASCIKSSTSSVSSKALLWILLVKVISSRANAFCAMIRA